MLNQYFEARKRLYPQKVKGRFRRLKWILNTIFLSIYFFTPYLRFDRGEGAPNQAILFDMPGSKIYFFGIEIWPQEVYYLAGILIIAAVALFFVTSLFGRIWCGYACFQTVWTDIFIACERLFQGDRNERILLDRKKNFEKFYKKFLTHLSWIIIALLTGYAFVGYFNDSISLTKNIFHGQISSTVLRWILGIAGATYIMAGFAREQVCIYMCPYSRFQSAMFDKSTLIISYDKERGEPRGKWHQGESFENRGHCIDCKQCVVVCPTGIDIRNGLQMECIACGLCVDACDNIMDKTSQPRGLIRYDTLNHLANPTEATKFRILRPRTILYSSVLLLVSSLMLRSLILKAPLETSVIPDRNPIFVTLASGDVRNGYTIKLMNKTHEKKTFSLSIKSPSDAALSAQAFEGGNLGHMEVLPDDVGEFKIYVTMSKESIEKSSNGRSLVEFAITDEKSGVEKKTEAVFIGK